MTDIDPADARPTPVMGQEIRRAVATVYEALSRYPRPTRLDASPILDGQSILSRITSNALGSLSPEQLRDFAAHAPHTVGTIDDYKHFLPRILELSIAQQSHVFGLDCGTIASRLKGAGWASWPASERRAIGNLVLLQLTDALNRHPDDISITDWVWAAVLLDLDLSAVLAHWLEARTPEAVLHLLVFLGDVHLSLPGGEGMWHDVDPATRKALACWLTSDAVAAAIVEGVDLVGEADLRRFDAADIMLSNLGAATWQ